MQKLNSALQPSAKLLGDQQNPDQRPQEPKKKIVCTDCGFSYRKPRQQMSRAGQIPIEVFTGAVCACCGSENVEVICQ